MVCRKKEDGGMGIKNLEWFNLALLAKWRWRDLKQDKELWHEILKSRYGVEAKGLCKLNLNDAIKYGSAWWKAICRVGSYNNSEDWLKKGLKMKLGVRNKVRFWEDIWYDLVSMSELFPRLYSVSDDKNKVIQNMGMWVEERWE